MKITVPNCMTVSVQDRRWFALRVRGGTADQVFAELKVAGYDAYLPRRRYDRHQRRLRVMAEWSEPLMPSYLFVVHPRPGQPIDDWTEVRAVKGVIGPLGSANGPLQIPTPAIEMIMTEEFSSVYDETKAAKKIRGDSERQRLERQFTPGSRHLVKDGPFASFLAEAESLTHDDRVRALVEIFGRLVPVEFEPEHLTEASKNQIQAA